MIERIGVLTLSLTLCACATTDPGITRRGAPVTTTVHTGGGEYELEMVPETRTSVEFVSAPIDIVWASLPKVYQELGIEPRTIISDEWAFGNHDLRARTIGGRRLAAYLSCGTNPIGAPIANVGDVHLNVLTRLKASGTGTEVRTTLIGHARSRSGAASESSCTSTGQLEELIAERLSELSAAENPEAEAAGSVNSNPGTTP